MTSTAASAVRSNLRDNRPLPGSPHTPSRFISSNFSSPGSNFRQEEDAVIIELKARFLCAGFEAESGPQCMISFSPNNNRRVGDYRNHLPEYRTRQENPETWHDGYELWRNDLKQFDLGLLEDKLERAIREVFNKYLLTEAGNARLVLVLPSLVPHPVLSSILTLLFERWKYPSITLLPIPTMAAVAAGVRSALVVDIGWEETVVTPIYEYRELPSSRSSRAMKMVVKSVGESLKPILVENTKPHQDALRFDFEFIEDLVHRMVTCESSSADNSDRPTGSTNQDQDITIEWPTSTSSRPINIPRTMLQHTLVHNLLRNVPADHPDDEETPLNELVYRSLLSLSPDIRSTCVSRIIFTGQGSTIPGLRNHIIHDVDKLIITHGWSAVRGTHVKPPRMGLVEIAQARSSPPDARHNSPLPPTERNPIEEKIQKQRARFSVPSPTVAVPPSPAIDGQLRVVETLGSWAGASLTTSLRVKGFVEVERDKFLNHGLAGASRELGRETSVVPQRTSLYGGPSANTAGKNGTEKGAWTLAGWA